MNLPLVARVERACADIVEQSGPFSFTEVARRSGTSKATLYRRPELRSIIEEHRAHHREAATLSGIAIELGHLRQGLEAVAARVRHHEELLRQLRRRSDKS